MVSLTRCSLAVYLTLLVVVVYQLYYQYLEVHHDVASIASNIHLPARHVGSTTAALTQVVPTNKDTILPAHVTNTFSEHEVTLSSTKFPQKELTTTSKRESINYETCDRLLRGETDGDYLVRSADTTSDEQIYLAASENCTEFRRNYRFMLPEYQVYEEEKNFTLAYSILAHDRIQQLALLLSAIYTPYNVYCIHIDAKSAPTTKLAATAISKCFDNVIMVSRMERVFYAHVSRLEADLNCFKDLLDFQPQQYQWKYLINLCAQDYPLRTNMEIITQMKHLRNTNLILGCKAHDELTLRRTQVVFRLENATDPSQPAKMRGTNIEHPPPPYNMTINKSLAYNFFTRDFIDWVIYKTNKSKALLEWSRDTYSPDEQYWMTLNNEPDAPGGKPGFQCWTLVRYIKWLYKVDQKECLGYSKHGLCVFNSSALFSFTKRNEI
ncbi:N-acetyllactosaminide beta-1,6-N-acetylglucosaminyl-transferase-like isoform X2 [Ciona intestinalis]